MATRLPLACAAVRASTVVMSPCCSSNAEAMRHASLDWAKRLRQAEMSASAGFCGMPPLTITTALRPGRPASASTSCSRAAAVLIACACSWAPWARIWS